MAGAPERREREDREAEPQRLADHLRIYLREPTLWPVLLVAVAILLTLGSAGLVAAWGERNRFAIAAVALLAAMSVDQIWRELRRGGPAGVTALVCGFWILSLAGAFAAIRLGLG